MTIEQFEAWLKEEMKSFKAYYEAQVRDEPESYPASQEAPQWMEQLQEYLGF